MVAGFLIVKMGKRQVRNKETRLIKCTPIFCFLKKTFVCLPTFPRGKWGQS